MPRRVFTLIPGFSLIFFLSATFLSVGLRSAEGTMVLPLDPVQLAAQAGRIFVGRCLDVFGDLDERGIPATYARFQVTEGIKGVETGQTILIKQFGAPRRSLPVGEGEKAIVTLKSMMPFGGAYRPGTEYLLYLYPESELGFTSPVGGGQGMLQILGNR